MLSDDLIQEQAYLVSRGVRPLALLESVSLEPAEMVNTFVRLNQVAVDPAIPFVLPRRDIVVDQQKWDRSGPEKIIVMKS